MKEDIFQQIVQFTKEERWEGDYTRETELTKDLKLGSEGSTNNYRHSADGIKLRTVHRTGSTTVTTDYFGSAVYENGTLSRILTEDGYITPGDGKLHYLVRDHQGNTRVVVDKEGNVEEVNHYYPFGGMFTSTANVQPYKYNGKELDTRNGLNWYDYGARHYDAAIGRWHAVDPMAEKYFSENPYMYCGDNPIVFVDPDGKMKVIYNPDGTYSKTTHNNWFHNFFIGRQEYIDYGSHVVQLTEEEFWLWQRTGNYGMIKPLNRFVSNFEFDLDKPSEGIIDGVEKFLKSSAYSLINSPKVWLTGKTWAGTTVTPNERTAGGLDVITSFFPSSKLIKNIKPVSYYKFKKLNSHIPINEKKKFYDMEWRKYKNRSQNHKAFEHVTNSVNYIQYTYNETTNERH